MSPSTSWRAGLHDEASPSTTRIPPIADQGARRIEPAHGGSIRPALRSLLLFVAASAVGAAVVFLLASDVLGVWNGHAVSVRPAAEDDPDTLVVRIVEPGGRLIERTWPSELVRGLHLPVDAIAEAPKELPETAAPTTKGRYDLHLLVRGATDTEWQVIPTTSPRAVVIAVVAFLLALFLRNMAVSGSPFNIEPRGVWLPPALAPSGTPAPTVGRNRSKQGPPPPGPRVGRGRR